MARSFAPGAELHINPAEQEAAEHSTLVYAVAAGLDHDRAGHVECAERMLEILKALADSNLTAAANPGQACGCYTTCFSSTCDIASALKQPSWESNGR